MNENQVLKSLKIKDLAQLDAVKIDKFVSIFSTMEPEVAKKALEQIPDLASTTKELVAQYKEVVTEGLKSNDESVKPFYEACMQILDSLDYELQKEDLTQEDRDRIVECSLLRK